MFDSISANEAIIYIYLGIILLLVIPLSIILKYYLVQQRKFNYVYLKELLTNYRGKISDQDDLSFLEEMLPKIERYYQKWWLNLGFYYAFKQRKIKLIARKYNIVIFEIYE